MSLASPNTSPVDMSSGVDEISLLSIKAPVRHMAVYCLKKVAACRTAIFNCKIRARTARFSFALQTSKWISGVTCFFWTMTTCHSHSGRAAPLVAGTLGMFVAWGFVCNACGQSNLANQL